MGSTGSNGFLKGVHSRGVVLYHGTASFVLVGLWRSAYALVLSRPGFRRRALVVGTGWAGQTIAQAVHQHLGLNYQMAFHALIWPFLAIVDGVPDKWLVHRGG